MANVIYYEIRKVFCNFRACLLFVAIVFLNLFLGVYFQYRDYETIINGRTQLEATKEALLSGTETRDLPRIESAWILSGSIRCI